MRKRGRFVLQASCLEILMANFEQHRVLFRGKI